MRILLISLLLALVQVTYAFKTTTNSIKFHNKWTITNHHNFNNGNKLFMSTQSEDTKKNNKSNKVNIDLSKYSIGQSHSGTILSAKNFGIFVTISEGVNVLIPRSVLSRGEFEKLKRICDTKSKESVNIELIGVSAEQGTLSAKYINPNFKQKMELSSLDPKTFSSKTFTATIVGAHDFGLFAEIDEYGIEGLIPASKIPKQTEGTIQKNYLPGTQVTVKIDELNVEGKKLVLSMNFGERADVSSFTNTEGGSNKWMQAQVTSVKDFGLFVRPAGSDNQGLVHISRIPRDLLAALKKISPPVEGKGNDVEQLFSAGDIIKCRVHSTNVETRRLELSMLPFRAKDDDDDDYIVEGRDTEEEEEEEDEKNSNDDDETVQYNAQDTLLWWKGQPYKKSETIEEIASVDEEFTVLTESTSVVEGSWRRMFEMDMREDEADFSSKALEAEIKEMEEEIGELNGLDEEMDNGGTFGISSTFNPKRFGSFVSYSSLPAGWKEELEFFKDLENVSNENMSDLRAGKSKEQLELESLLKEVEQELQQAAKKVPKVVTADESAEAPVV